MTALAASVMVSKTATQQSIAHHRSECSMFFKQTVLHAAYEEYVPGHIDWTIISPDSTQNHHRQTVVAAAAAAEQHSSIYTNYTHIKSKEGGREPSERNTEK